MTPAISELENAGFEYELLNYHYDPSVGSYGTDLASKLGLNSEAVFKTLSELNTGEFIVCLIPVSSSLDLKAVARELELKELLWLMVKSLSEELGTSWAVFLLSVKAAPPNICG